MKALSILQPWAWAIVHGPKDVENRSWRPPAAMIGERIAIHASARKPRDEFTVHVAYSYGIELPPRSYMPLGAIVGTAILSGVRSNREQYDPDWRWHERGLWGWLLTDRRPLQLPIPIPGQLGLWEVPASIVSALTKSGQYEPFATCAVSSQHQTAPATAGVNGTPGEPAPGEI